MFKETILLRCFWNTDNPSLRDSRILRVTYVRPLHQCRRRLAPPTSCNTFHANREKLKTCARIEPLTSSLPINACCVWNVICSGTRYNVFSLGRCFNSSCTSCKNKVYFSTSRSTNHKSSDM